MNSSEFLAIASAALFVLVFQGGVAGDSEDSIDSEELLITDASSVTKCVEYDTTKLIRGGISCVPTLTRSDYNIVPNVGAFMIRQLAVMDSQQKHDLFLQWKRGTLNMGFWLGFHDLFEEGTWVTITGESIDSIGYTPWADNEHEDGVDGENCAVLFMSGMHDYKCTKTAGFICEINLCETLGHQVHTFRYN